MTSKGCRNNVTVGRETFRTSSHFVHMLNYRQIKYTEAFDCVDHNKLWKILKEMRLQDHLTCLLRNLYAGQEAIVGTGHGNTNCFQIMKGVHQDCILSPCLHAEHIM